MEKVKNKLNSPCGCREYVLILMDINMPIMNGIEAGGLIRSWERSRQTSRAALIALTAADTEKNVLRDQYQTLGFDELVGKPISRVGFVEILVKYGLILS